MKNKFFLIKIYLILSLCFFSNLNSEENFFFNVSEIEISQNGNLFKGSNGGEAYTNDGISISAENFEYNKLKQHLKAINNVKFKDNLKNLIIKADEISYFKNEEIILAKGKVFVLDQNKNIEIFADSISYNNTDESKIVADGDVKFFDKKNDIEVISDKITYLKNLEKIFTEGQTKAKIQSKYKFESRNVSYSNKDKKLRSSEKTTIENQDYAFYELDNFIYEIDKEFLKGKKIKVTENSKLPLGETNTYFFENGFFDLKNNNYKTGETKILLKKNIFDKSENDPRLYGVSSNHENNITTINKAVFTSCKKNNNCPPWQIEASKIKHDKNKKQLIYENSILKVYNFPVFYFPKFSILIQLWKDSLILLPKLNNSNILGSSINTPYFHVISENKDFTIAPTIFSENTQMIQNEYRQENKDSSFIADFGFVNNFKSSETNKKKNISHLFANFKKNLELDSFLNSDLNIFIQRATKDTYLKIFSDNLYDNEVRPNNFDVLQSGFEILLDQINSLFLVEQTFMRI